LTELFWSSLPTEIPIGLVSVTAIEAWQVLLDLQAEQMRAMDLDRQPKPLAAWNWVFVLRFSLGLGMGTCAR
jgi:hypothetical protein